MMLENKKKENRSVIATYECGCKATGSNVSKFCPVCGWPIEGTFPRMHKVQYACGCCFKGRGAIQELCPEHRTPIVLAIDYLSNKPINPGVTAKM